MKTAARKVATPEPVQPNLLTRLTRYRKTIAAIVGAGITWVTAALGDGSDVTRVEWIALATAVATALGVFASPNEPLEGGDEGNVGVLELAVIALVVVVILLLVGVID